jgi:hypothetical protein
MRETLAREPPDESSPRAAEGRLRLGRYMNGTLSRSLPYTNLGVIGRNAAIRCGHFSL